MDSRLHLDSAASLLATTCIGAATLLCIGAPDLSGAIAFLSGSREAVAPVSDAAAFSGVLCWALIGVLLCVTLVQTAREMRLADVHLSHAGRAILLVMVAATLLATAVLRHGGTDTLCCASTAAQMQQVVRLAG